MCYCRYLTIFCDRSRRLTQRQAAVLIVVVWLMSCVIFAPWLSVYHLTTFNVTGFSYVQCHVLYPSPALRQVMSWVILLINYILPLLFIALCYSLIGMKVWRRKVGGLEAHSRAQRALARSKARTLAMLFVVFVVFALCWLPLYTIQMWVLMGGSPKSVSHVLPFAQWLGAANSCANPFIYCYFSATFRQYMTQAACGNTAEARPLAGNSRMSKIADTAFTI